ncbi:patatin-like phospholipase family protein [Fulvivirga maritima]|uniref:patatin-like phospholipase family protein n=1 Tax=Fulvivirga maritima TaxID=2904247 RepID=UPI001F16134A|nr:patatin-like phospholipase family protein [Fulvivirga maritima]UII25976.1 patatin-like phospholipase family protein [Fulvivirga maritima]
MSSIINHKADRALVLAGGGMRVAYQAGVLLALEEGNYLFKHVDGTSGGIFNTAMLASGVKVRSIAERWRSLNVMWFSSLRKFKNYLHPFRMKGYADTDNIKHKVFRHMGIAVDRINRNTDSYTFNICNFSNKAIEPIPNEKVMEDHLLAGVSLPILMPALKIKNEWYTDAVWIKDANLIDASSKGVAEIWLVWAIGNNHNYLDGAFNQYVHMIEMSAGGALLQEFEQMKFDPQLNLSLHVIKPDYPLPLDPDLFFNKIDTRSLINMGYADAKNYLGNIKSEGVPMDAAATKMREPGDRLHIHCVFQGAIERENDRQDIQLFCYYRYSIINEAETIITLFASIKLEEEEYPLFNTSTNLKLENEGLFLVTEALLYIHSVQHNFTIKLPVISSIDPLIGLAFKTAEIKLANEQKCYEGELKQSISHRLKNCLRMNVLTADGRHGSLKTKYKMLNQLLRV